MKRFLFVLTVGLVALVSCKKETEEKTNPVPEQLWKNNFQIVAKKSNNIYQTNLHGFLYIGDDGKSYQAENYFGSKQGKLRWEPGQSTSRLVLLENDGGKIILENLTYDDSFMYFTLENEDYILAYGGRKFAGIILDQVTNLPASGVIVDLIQSSNIIKTDTTDNNGLYCLANSGGDCTIQVRKIDYADANRSGISTAPDCVNVICFIMTAGSSSLNSLSGRYIATPTPAGFDYDYIDFEANKNFTMKGKLTGYNEDVVTGTYTIVRQSGQDYIEFRKTGATDLYAILKKISDTLLQSIDGSKSYIKQ